MKSYLERMKYKIRSNRIVIKAFVWYEIERLLLPAAEHEPQLHVSVSYVQSCCVLSKKSFSIIKICKN